MKKNTFLSRRSGRIEKVEGRIKKNTNWGVKKRRTYMALMPFC